MTLQPPPGIVHVLHHVSEWSHNHRRDCAIVATNLVGESLRETRACGLPCDCTGTGAAPRMPHSVTSSHPHHISRSASSVNLIACCWTPEKFAWSDGKRMSLLPVCPACQRHSVGRERGGHCPGCKILRVPKNSVETRERSGALLLCA